MKHNPMIFMIDDDTDDQEIFNIALQDAHEDAICIFANDGLDALEKLNADKTLIPDFIFIDMNMPRMNGHQCLVELKKMERIKEIPIYMYSTSSDPAVITESKKLGAKDFISKPADINMLTKILSDIIKSKV